MSEDWKAAAWRLERRAPRRYGPRVQLAVQQELDAIVSKLEKGLPPDQYQRVLQIMTSDEEEMEPDAPDRTLARLPDH